VLQDPPLSFTHITLHCNLGPILPSTSVFSVSRTPHVIKFHSLVPSIPKILKYSDQINGPRYLSSQRLQSNHDFAFRKFSKLHSLTFPLCKSTKCIPFQWTVPLILVFCVSGFHKFHSASSKSFSLQNFDNSSQLTSVLLL
jgi:hypothetical protein